MDNGQTLNSDIYQQIKSYIALIRDQGIPVEKVILFGSFAKGQADANSDIDLCIVSPKFGKDYHNELVNLLKLGAKTDYQLDPIPFAHDDLEEKYDPLAAEIRKHGIVLNI